MGGKDAQGHGKQERVNRVAHINRKRKEAGTLCIGETESVALNVLPISQVFCFLLRDVSETLIY